MADQMIYSIEIHYNVFRNYETYHLFGCRDAIFHTWYQFKDNENIGWIVVREATGHQMDPCGMTYMDEEATKEFWKQAISNMEKANEEYNNR
jgi:hypothetical protein